MDQREVFEEWQANKDRPAYVREHRETLAEHIDTSDPIPEDGTLSRVRDWLQRYRGTVTRQLNPNSGGED
jgi:hypothetical protein